MQSTTTFRATGDEIAAKVIDGEAIIINLATGTYYSSAEAGALTWQLAEQGHSLETISQALEKAFVVPAETDLTADLATFFASLVKEKLMEVAESGTSDIAAPQLEPTGKAYQPPALSAYRDMDDMLALDPPVPGLEPIPFNDPESVR